MGAAARAAPSHQQLLLLLLRHSLCSSSCSLQRHAARVHRALHARSCLTYEHATPHHTPRKRTAHLWHVLWAQAVLQLQRRRLDARAVGAERPRLAHAAHVGQRLLHAHAARRALGVVMVAASGRVAGWCWAGGSWAAAC